MLDQTPPDFSQFIEFGNIFDRSTRAYLVKYLSRKLDPSLDFKEELTQSSPEFEHLQKALDQIFAHQNLQDLGQAYPRLQHEIIRDTLHWIRQSHTRNKRENPYKEEQKELERWHTRPTFMWARHWYKLTNYLRDIYTPEDLDTKFYAQKFEQISQKIDAWELERNPKTEQYAPELAEMELVIEDLLGHWQSLLTAKRLQYELENIEKQREEFCELLYAKVEEFVKLLNIITPFQAEIGRYWDMSRGLWQDTGFDVLNQYAELLQKEESIRDLADQLGRLREAQTEIEEEFYEESISRKTWVDDYSLQSEIGGIHTSNDLNNILPSEASFLAFPETESVFLKKYAEQNLLTFQKKGQRLVEHDDIQYHSYKKQKRKIKGPFIICVDTSGSMEGLPEQIAKVLSFAIIKMAARENRQCFLISFSIGIKTINLSNLAYSLDEVVRFLSMSFHGGTDVSPAMYASIDMLQSHDYREADVLMVSDFVMYEIREEVLRKIRQEKEKGTQFHSLTISKNPNPEIIEEFDNTWIYNPEERGIIRHLAHDLRAIA